ncbi:hypothetical protein BJY52DRAFT_1228151 [Lactarius psammicola]|nr:hypothetical protein BJY52DRAFT_1228151 [Lactarius psammicola]
MDGWQGHSLNVPIDLSQNLIHLQANSLDTISPPLLDRCEVIQSSGYLHDEKLHMARRFLIPEQLTKNELSEAHVQLTEPTLLQTIAHSTREAGARRGVVWGLVVTGMGEGEIMPVESIATPGSGRLKLTDSLGDESAELELSWVKMHALNLGITSKRAEEPRPVPDAMIDVTHRGLVSPVGGIEEEKYWARIVWVPDKVIRTMGKPEGRAEGVREALDAAFGEGTLSRRRTLAPVVESRP